MSINRDLKPNEFASFKKTGRVGVPTKPVCSDINRELGLLAVGTYDSHVHFLGGGNCQWITHLPAVPINDSNSRTISSVPAKIYWINGISACFVLCTNRSIFRIRMEGSELIRDLVPRDVRVKDIKAATVLNKGMDSYLLIVNSDDTIYSIEAKSLKTSLYLPFDRISNQFPAFQGGGIVSIAYSKVDRQLAIATSKGALAVIQESTTDIISSHEIPDFLEISFSAKGSLIITTADGKYYIRTSSSPQLSAALSTSDTLFPCSQLKHMRQAANCNGDQLIIYSGGVPKPTLSEKHIVSINRENMPPKRFELGMEVLDIHLTKNFNDDSDSFVIIVTSSELVFLDLSDSSFRQLPRSPYFPFHYCDISASIVCSDIKQELWTEMQRISQLFWKKLDFSQQSEPPLWAFKQGAVDTISGPTVGSQRQIMLTGCEDGSIRIFDISSMVQTLLFVIDTKAETAESEEELVVPWLPRTSCSSNGPTTNGHAARESSDDEEEESATEDKTEAVTLIGLCDEYGVDDNQFAIRSLSFCNTSGTLIATSVTGNVLIYTLSGIERRIKPQTEQINFIEQPPSPSKNGSDNPKPARPFPHTYLEGFQPYVTTDATTEGEAALSLFLQCSPADPLRHCIYLDEMKLIALASDHTVKLYYLVTRQVVWKRSFKEQTASSRSGLFAAFSHFRRGVSSFRESARLSMTASRRRRMSRNRGTMTRANVSAICDPNARIDPLDGTEEPEVPTKPEPIQERSVEERNIQDLNRISSLAFFKTSHQKGQSSQQLAIGFIGQLVTIHIHLLPSMGLSFKDGTTVAMSDRQSKTRITHMIHYQENGKTGLIERVAVIMENEIRIYSDDYKHSTKLKLTKKEGVKAVKAEMVTLHREKVEDRHETGVFLAVLLNNDQVRLYSTALTRSTAVSYQLFAGNDTMARASLMFSPFGEVFYMRVASAEYQRCSLSSHSLAWKHPFESIASKETWPASQK